MGDFADVGLAIPRLLNISNPNVIELKSCVEQPGTLGLVAGFYCIAKSYPPKEPPGPPPPAHLFFCGTCERTWTCERTGRVRARAGLCATTVRFF